MPLDQQDRSRWDRALIGQASSTSPRRGDGRGRRRAATISRRRSPLATARRATFDKTDWVSICHLYDRLLEMAPSPMVALNRAVAVSYRDGPKPRSRWSRRSEPGGSPHSHVVAAVLANLYARAGSAERVPPLPRRGARVGPDRHERELIARQIERARRLLRGWLQDGPHDHRPFGLFCRNGEPCASSAASASESARITE